MIQDANLLYFRALPGRTISAILEGIRTILNNIKSGATPLIMAVFLLVFGMVFGSGSRYGGTEQNSVVGVLGGPVAPAVEKLPLISQGVSGASLFPEADAAHPLSQERSGAFLAVAQADVALFPAGAQTVSVIYTIKKKDTIGTVAKAFGVSPKDILDSNPSLKRSQKLKAGATLAVFLPVKPPENQSSLVEAALQDAPSPAYSGSITLSAAKNYFAMPADGFNWGKLHNYNAVDIANVCGTSIVAPADGIVVSDEHYGDGHGDWNGGYGHFVLLEHGNGTKTRMAHLDTILVAVGDLVKKGQKIGTMGATGDATGCHVHFEVIGAPNPFEKS